MPHELLIDGERLAMRDGVVEIARRGAPPLVRVHALASGEVVVLAGADGSLNGRTLPGGLAVVTAGALLRVGGQRIDLVWRDACERRSGLGGRDCRLCFGALAAAEVAVVCACGSAFHATCDALRADCSGCGRVREEA